MKMKEVSIHVAKSEKGYRVIVVDDAKTDDNPDEFKSNTAELNPADKEQLLADIQTVLSGIE
jgi:hypothetical protein